jgi:hypothetical protein
MPAWQLAKYLGERASYMTDKDVAMQFSRIKKGDPKGNIVDTSLANYLKLYLQIGKGVYSNFRLLLRDKVEFSPYYKLVQEIKSFQPPVEFRGNGVFCNLKDCITITASRALQLSVVPGSDEADLIKRWGVVLKIVAGLDGSGHHPVYSTESTLDSQVDASHIIVAGFALLEIRVNDLDATVVFKDSHQCCSDAERPFILLTGKEDKENSRILNELIDTQASEMQSQRTDISCGELGVIKADLDFDQSQMDGKVQGIALGLGGPTALAARSQKLLPNFLTE